MVWHTHFCFARKEMKLAGFIFAVLLLSHQSGCSETSGTSSEVKNEEQTSTTDDLTGSDAIIILPCPYIGHYQQVNVPAIVPYPAAVPAVYTTPTYEETTYTTTTEPTTTTEYYEPPTTTTTEYYEPPSTTETYYAPTTEYRAPMTQYYTTSRPYYPARPKPTVMSYRYTAAPTPKVVQPSYVERPKNNYNNFKVFRPVKDYSTSSYFSQYFPPSHMYTTYTHYYTTEVAPPRQLYYDVMIREPLPSTTTTEYYVEPITEAPVYTYVAPAEPIVIEPTPPVVESYVTPTPCNCNTVVSEPIVIVEEPEPEPTIPELPCDKKDEEPEQVAIYYSTTTPPPVYETEPPVVAVSYEPPAASYAEPPAVSYQPELPCDKETTTEYSAPSYDTATQAPTYTSYEPPLTAYSQPGKVDESSSVASRPVIGYTAQYGFPGPYLSMAYGYPNLPCTACQQQPQQLLAGQHQQAFLVLLPMWYQAALPVPPTSGANNVVPPAYYAPSYSYENAIPQVYSSPSDSYDNTNKPAYGKYLNSQTVTSAALPKETEAKVEDDETVTGTSISMKNDENFLSEPVIELASSVLMETLFYPTKRIASTVPSGHAPFLPSPFLLAEPIG